MKSKILVSVLGLVFLGWGCTSTPPVIDIQTVDTQTALPQTDSNAGADLVVTTTGKTLAVERTFTLDEIETEGGGLKNWFRDLARANVAGQKTLVRVPINHVQGFGCVVPTKYCVSTITGGCYGPFVDLKTNSSIIAAAPGTLWEVEGYVVAANRLPVVKDGDAQSICADGELAYDFEVTKVIQKLDTGYSDEYKFIQYSVE